MKVQATPAMADQSHRFVPGFRMKVETSNWNMEPIIADEPVAK